MNIIRWPLVWRSTYENERDCRQEWMRAATERAQMIFDLQHRLAASQTRYKELQRDYTKKAMELAALKRSVPR